MEPEGSNNRLSRSLSSPRIESKFGATDGEARATKVVLDEVRRLLDEYTAEVIRCYISPRSQDIYCKHAEYFVRWMHGGFVPGAAGRRPRHPRRSPEPFE
jgi:hypothetical protein